MRKRTIVQATIALNVPTKVGALVTYTNNVVEKMTNNPAFPSPTPTLAALTAAAADLQKAETAALTKAVGATTVRDEKRAILVSLLRQLKGYVQGVADATPENGASIIQSAGLAVRKTSTHAARSFDARPGAVSGSAKLVAVSAGPRSSYEWQYSPDGGKSWVVVPSTIQAKTTVGGLTVGATVLFRYRPVTRTGEGDWSQTVALVVK